jgi:hypothetical protein
VDSSAEREADAVAARVEAGNDGGSGIAEIVPPNILRRQPRASGARSWSAGEFITAGVGNWEDTCWSAINPQDRYGYTSDGTDRPYSRICPEAVCADARLPLHFAFHVDSQDTPRPQPFEKSKVAINLVFLSARGKEKTVLSATSNGIYMKPGLALLTSFDVSTRFTPPGPGTLLVSMIHADPSSGEVAVYGDETPIVDCSPPVERVFGQPTGIYVVIPDPQNAPLDYHRLTMEDGLDRPGISVEVERDDAGYFYIIEEQKYYIPEKP